jgi:hypothetical protein
MAASEQALFEREWVLRKKVQIITVLWLVLGREILDSREEGLGILEM